ncbi:hypothetical protein [Dictyobacter kobayashii]|uniref:Uncharacterized protein n=1 Tax=Dictyobacter kobayashii TaxID=2014872 RepID=A0A402ABB8_9CHLR|nr:hypothetical protein [Dictyobacter kobayashii]GCE16301.1 hypothetical protein KDK_01010 [Dictyobacter kobayashii]
MEPEDYLEPEIAVTAVVAAALFSPRARKFIRQGLVYGTAGALIAGDAITSFAHSVSRSFEQTRMADKEQPISQPEVSTEGLGG